MTENDQSARIRELNDELRAQGVGGLLMMTAGVNAMDERLRAEVIAAVVEFDAFDEGNDPYSHHDFGSVTVQTHSVFWKIDYYDLSMKYGSTDPSDPEQTRRVLTIMLSSEY